MKPTYFSPYLNAVIKLEHSAYNFFHKFMSIVPSENIILFMDEYILTIVLDGKSAVFYVYINANISVMCTERLWMFVKHV